MQSAVRLVIEPIFEADFSDSSYGARPGRSAHQALEVVGTGLRKRQHRVVDVDLSRFFDTIRHDRMMAKVARRVCDDGCPSGVDITGCSVMGGGHCWFVDTDAAWAFFRAHAR